MYTKGIKKKEYINVSQQLEIYIFRSLDKQYMKGIQKWKEKFFLMMESKIATSIYCSLAEYELYLSCSKKRGEKGRELVSTIKWRFPRETPNGNANSFREIIIYCLPKKVY